MEHARPCRRAPPRRAPPVRAPPSLPRMRRRALPSGTSDGTCGWERCGCRGTRIVVTATPRGEHSCQASGDPSAGGSVCRQGADARVGVRHAGRLHTVGLRSLQHRPVEQTSAYSASLRVAEWIRVGGGAAGECRSGEIRSPRPIAHCPSAHDELTTRSPHPAREGVNTCGAQGYVARVQGLHTMTQRDDATRQCLPKERPQVDGNVPVSWVDICPGAGPARSLGILPPLAVAYTPVSASN